MVLIYTEFLTSMYNPYFIHPTVLLELYTIHNNKFIEAAQLCIFISVQRRSVYKRKLAHKLKNT